jgi:hypothetical protein
MKMGRGMGAPKAPPLPKFGLGGIASEGGSRGEDHRIGEPVECNVAGGEFLVGPISVYKVGLERARDLGLRNPPLKKIMNLGHDELDRWILRTRKKHISTLKGLPPPAKK